MQYYTHAEIGEVLRVSVGFVNKWKYAFFEQGTGGLILKYQGSRGYLTSVQRQAVIDWLKQKNCWHLAELKQDVEDSFGTVFASNQSYYELDKEADISWKNPPKKNPRKDPDLGGKKNRK